MLPTTVMLQPKALYLKCSLTLHFLAMNLESGLLPFTCVVNSFIVLPLTVTHVNTVHTYSLVVVMQKVVAVAYINGMVP